MKTKTVKLSKRDETLIGKLLIGSEGETIHNRFGGGSCDLDARGVALYDYIMGCEAIGDIKGQRQGLDLFRKLYPSEYMTLLD